MKKVFAAIIGIAVLATAMFVWYHSSQPAWFQTLTVTTADSEAVAAVVGERPALSVIAENLMISWEVLFLPGEEILVTKRPGRIALLTSGKSDTVENISNTGEEGLLRAVLYPDFVTNNWLIHHLIIISNLLILYLTEYSISEIK